MVAPSNEPPRRTPPPPDQPREISPSIRAFAQIGDHNTLTRAGQAFDLIVGRKAMATPVNAALFAVLVELHKVARHPEPAFDEIRRLVDDLEFLKEQEAPR